jgi:hypothetical protein
MATFTQIKAVRLTINDPADFIDIISVDSVADLPASTGSRIAYYLVDTGEYKSWNGTAWVDIADMEISDSRIGPWLDSFSESGAIIRGFDAIIQRLGQRLQMSKNSDGAESTEYTSLDSMLKYYRQIKADYITLANSEVKQDTGLYGHIADVEISGGLV